MRNWPKRVGKASCLLRNHLQTRRLWIALLRCRRKKHRGTQVLAAEAEQVFRIYGTTEVVPGYESDTLTGIRFVLNLLIAPCSSPQLQWRIRSLCEIFRLRQLL